jgi:hypothetical protein
LAATYDLRNTSSTESWLESIQEPIFRNEFGEVKQSLFITVVRDGQFVVVE